MFDSIEILQLYPEKASDAAARAIRFSAVIANKLGAKLYVKGVPPIDSGYGFYDAEETVLADQSAKDWAGGAEPGTLRLIVTAGEPGSSKDVLRKEQNTVYIELANWETEETLFASSGVAHILGDPEREPLVPEGNFAAHTIGYAAFAAISSIAVKFLRFGQGDSAIVNGAGVLPWVNWKSAIHASLGGDPTRQGAKAEWPIVDCKDGHAAFLYNDRDWDEIVKMVGDPALDADKFRTFQGRQENRDAYMVPIRQWLTTKTKAELTDLFEKHAIPGAPVCTVSDLLKDPLLTHRDAFERMPSGARRPKLAHRVAREEKHPLPADTDLHTNELPLSGLRVLDFGIITAGAGVSALLADMGAEVLKIESHNRADPFRIWPGAKPADTSDDVESPVFKSNNRNKLGVAIDLKTEEGKREFLELAKSADIVIENYRRGVLDRLGLTFDALREANPRILLASISGQGLDGPGSGHTTFGSTLEANSGFASITCYEEGIPYISGRALNYPDQIVCLYGAAIVAAFAADCRKKGVARHLDVSQRDCTVYQLGDVIANVSTGAKDSADAVRQAAKRPALSALFKCADGAYAALTAQNTAIASRVEDLNSIDVADVHKWALERSAEAAVSAFLAAGGGGVVSRGGPGLFKDESLFATHIYQHSPNGALVKGFPFQLIDTPMTVWGNSPKVGEHTEQFIRPLSAA